MSDLSFPDLRRNLVPETLVFVKIFEQLVATQDLEQQIKTWVSQTGNLIVQVGPVTLDAGIKRIALTYVAAVEGNYDVRQEKVNEGTHAAVQVPASLESNSGGSSVKRDQQVSARRFSDGSM